MCEDTQRIVGFLLGWLLWIVVLLCLAIYSGVQTAHAGNFPGEQPSYAREVGIAQRFYYVASGNGTGQIEYICKCFPGTTGCGTTSSAVWQVQRFTYDSSNRISTIGFAAGDDAYGSICDNRTSLTYVN